MRVPRDGHGLCGHLQTQVLRIWELCLPLTPRVLYIWLQMGKDKGCPVGSEFVGQAHILLTGAQSHGYA